MQEPSVRVGIVVRTRNRPAFLRRALLDVQRQTFAHWRMHIVNDGGDPGPIESILDEVAPQVRARIDVTHNPVSAGRSAAANQGVSALDAEYIVLHDDDDLWRDTFLDSTVAWLDQHPGDAAAVVRTDIVYEEQDDSGEFVEVRRAPFWADLHEISYTDLLEINRVVPIACLYRTSLHEAVGMYREDLHAAEDWDFYLRAAVRHHFGFIDGPAQAFWMHRVGVTGDLGNSMYALSDQHLRYDRIVRDDALRAYVDAYGAGVPLFLVAFLRDEIRTTIREEVSQLLAENPTDLQRIARRLRALRWWPRPDRP